jgi:hypothetical protein
VEVSAFDFQGIDVQVRDLSRAGDYAEAIPESPRFSVIPDDQFGIHVDHNVFCR